MDGVPDRPDLDSQPAPGAPGATATARALASAARTGTLPPVSRGLQPGLLSFYDRLRERILAAVEKRGGKMGSTTVKALLVVPDIFILLARLALDKQVPAPSRALIAGALVYFVMPADLLPEAILGVGGYLEDL